MKWKAITGLPRSGTTLTCYLLNKFSNVVALHEPMSPQRDLKGKSRSEMIREVLLFFRQQQESLISENIAISKNRNSEVPDNPIPPQKRESHFKRKTDLNKSPITFDKIIDSNSILAIKHPSLFTALLPELKNEISTYAVLRNPLATIMSWNSVDFPISKGHIPTAEFIDMNLKEDLLQELSMLKRQIIIFKWFYGKYLEQINDENIIYYEDIVNSNGSVLDSISGMPGDLTEELHSKNSNEGYNYQNLEQIYGALENSYEKSYERFYRFDTITALFEKMKSK